MIWILLMIVVILLVLPKILDLLEDLWGHVYCWIENEPEEPDIPKGYKPYTNSLDTITQTFAQTP